MEILGTPKCSLQFKYITRGAIISTTDFRAMGLVENIKEKHQFSEWEEDEENEHISFENGRFKIGKEWYAIDKLDIGNKSMSALIHGPTAASRQILDEIVSLVESEMPHTELSKRKKIEEAACTLRARLRFDPAILQNPIIVEFARGICQEMGMTEFSLVQTHFPSLQIHFVSEPDIKRLLSVADTDTMQAEVAGSVGDKRLFIRCRNPEDYRNRIYEITIETDLESGMEILNQLEKRLSDKGR